MTVGKAKFALINEQLIAFINCFTLSRSDDMVEDPEIGEWKNDHRLKITKSQMSVRFSLPLLPYPTLGFFHHYR